MSDNKSFEGWAIIELFGHNVIAGLVSEQAIGGAAFVRVDVPGVNGSEPFTKFFNGSAIYALTPTDEATASAAASRLAVRPVTPWVVPDTRKELPPPTVDPASGVDDEWDDRDQNVDDDYAHATD